MQRQCRCHARQWPRWRSISPMHQCAGVLPASTLCLHASRYLDAAANMRADGRGTHPDELPGRAASVANRMAQFAEQPGGGGGGAAKGAAHDHRPEHGQHDSDMLPQVPLRYDLILRAQADTKREISPSGCATSAAWALAILALLNCGRRGTYGRLTAENRCSSSLPAWYIFVSSG